MRARNGAISSVQKRTSVILNAISIEQEEMVEAPAAAPKKKKTNMMLKR
jgi:hypothetical protein